MGAVIGILFVAMIAVVISLAASGNMPGDWTGFNLAGEGKVVIEPKGGPEASEARPPITSVPKSEWCPSGYALSEIQSITREGTPRVVEVCERLTDGALDPLQVLAEIEGVEQSRITCYSTAADPYCSVTFKIDLDVMSTWEEGK